MRLTLCLLALGCICLPGCTADSDVPEELRAPPGQPITPADMPKDAPKGAVPADRKSVV